MLLGYERSTCGLVKNCSLIFGLYLRVKDWKGNPSLSMFCMYVVCDTAMHLSLEVSLGGLYVYFHCGTLNLTY